MTHTAICGVCVYMCARHGIYLVVKVYHGRTYRRTIREAQRINSDVRVERSVEQNRGSMYKNLILRLHRRMRLHNKLKSKRYA